MSAPKEHKESWSIKEIKKLRDAMIAYHEHLSKAQQKEAALAQKKIQDMRTTGGMQAFDLSGGAQSSASTAGSEHPPHHDTLSQPLAQNQHQPDSLLSQKIKALENLHVSIFGCALDPSQKSQQMQQPAATSDLESLQIMMKKVDQPDFVTLKMRRGHGEGEAYSTFWSKIDAILKRLHLYSFSVTGAGLVNKIEKTAKRASHRLFQKSDGLHSSGQQQSAESFNLNARRDKGK
jgi:hypothetical protein